MGERGNIQVGKVWLYTHWRGHELKEILKSALIRGHSRWRDEQYLTRIIFCEMVAGDEMGCESFGIWHRMMDNNYPVLVVDVDRQQVMEYEVDMDNRKLGKRICVWSFKDFVEESD